MFLSSHCFNALVTSMLNYSYGLLTRMLRLSPHKMVPQLLNSVCDLLECGLPGKSTSGGDLQSMLHSKSMANIDAFKILGSLLDIGHMFDPPGTCSPPS